MAQSNPIESNPIQCNPMQSNAIQCNPMQSNAIQCNPIKSCWIHFNSIMLDQFESNPIPWNPIQSKRILFNPIQTNPIQSKIIRSAQARTTRLYCFVYYGPLESCWKQASLLSNRVIYRIGPCKGIQRPNRYLNSYFRLPYSRSTTPPP